MFHTLPTFLVSTLPLQLNVIQLLHDCMFFIIYLVNYFKMVSYFFLSSSLSVESRIWVERERERRRKKNKWLNTLMGVVKLEKKKRFIRLWKRLVNFFYFKNNGSAWVMQKKTSGDVIYLREKYKKIEFISLPFNLCLISVQKSTLQHSYFFFTLL